MRSKIIKIPLYPGNLCIIDAEKPSELKKFGLESIFEADEVLYCKKGSLGTIIKNISIIEKH